MYIKSSEMRHSYIWPYVKKDHGEIITVDFIYYMTANYIVFCKCQIFKEIKSTDFEIAKSSIVESLMIVLIVVVLGKDDPKNVYWSRRPR